MSNDSYVKDILPPKPEAPLPSDCCGTGCSPCVYDIYEEDLKKWKKSCEQLKLDDSPKDQQAIISTNKFTSVKLIGVTQITNNTFIYQFELPEKTCLCLQIGHHIVIKGILDNKGKMSTIISKLSIGDQIEIRGPYGSFKYQPNSFKRLVFLAAGTGIAPMFQIIQQILKDEEDMTRLHLMYSSKSFKDILLREELYKISVILEFHSLSLS
ncbi:NADH-cytochrome b5 reductase-like [Armadillidium nasatum]|uniref:cytochrome-b5 reductase n=1 Tax=Armadillidium nasatum TaxID=96803 RepID=A0A5N5STE1_9CRUS|nr:NADH-cytochrome b5 reductase-like [Armadillidium nasatum]